MDQQKSQFLHGLRWISALLVVIGHSEMIGGKVGDPVFLYLASHAHAAVMVFFVLSGYVIAATVDKRRAAGYSLSHYFLDRFSRIYSVLIPALLLTLALDLAGRHWFPDRYADPEVMPQTHALLRLFVNLFCLQGVWGYRVQFGSDPALWSVGYEVCYYVLFGLCVWRPRLWQWMVAAVLLVVGPTVAFYGLIWCLGVWAYRSHKTVPLVPALLVFLVANHFLEYQPVNMPELCRDFLFAMTVALLVCTTPRIPARLFSFNREMAEFSFSLYAYHMPILFFAYSFVTVSWVSAWGMVFLSLVTVRALYHVTERQRSVLREWMLRAIQTAQPSSLCEIQR